MLSADIYKTRRQKVSRNLHAAPVFITAFEAMQQTNDASAPFIQESSFFWLTGIVEPGWQLVIEAHKSTLIAPAKTEIQRIFDGGMSADEAKYISGVEEVILGDQLDAFLKDIAKTHKTAYTIFKHPHSRYFDFVLNPAIKKLKTQLTRNFDEVEDCRIELARLKAIKSSEEIDAIKQAIAISIEGFEKMKNNLQAYRYEYEAEAELSYVFRAKGSEGHAYQPIVATGKNACTLHYIENNALLPAKGLLLVDAGARVNGYAADITRTYAIGTPSAREIAVHTEVEKAHKEIIQLIKPELSFKDYHNKSDAIMKQALTNLDLLNEEDDFRRYFPHAVSHGLGIDVHDSLGGYETFQPGMVLTVEPGIYIPEEGIGIRIEDDILVTETGYENLSVNLPTSL